MLVIEKKKKGEKQGEERRGIAFKSMHVILDSGNYNEREREKKIEGRCARSNRERRRRKKARRGKVNTA